MTDTGSVPSPIVYCRCSNDTSRTTNHAAVLLLFDHKAAVMVIRYIRVMYVPILLRPAIEGMNRGG